MVQHAAEGEVSKRERKQCNENCGGIHVIDSPPSLYESGPLSVDRSRTFRLQQRAAPYRGLAEARKLCYVACLSRIYTGYMLPAGLPATLVKRPLARA